MQRCRQTRSIQTLLSRRGQADDESIAAGNTSVASVLLENIVIELDELMVHTMDDPMC